MNTINGCLLINKEIGDTSFFVDKQIKKIFHIKKVGHLGTLDPFASGLLLIMLGDATKIAPFIENCDKEYIAELKLGEKTDTLDCKGNIIDTKDVPFLNKNAIEDILLSFKGDILQIPPMYSALKKDGEPLYKLARQGIEIERKTRKVTIHDIKLLSFSDNKIIFKVLCSKGTYIRTLGEDIATKLNTVGHLTNLKRTKIGSYKIEDSFLIKDVCDSSVIPLAKCLQGFKVFSISEQHKKKALNGCPLHFDCNDQYICLNDENGLIAIYELDKNGMYKCARGFR